MSEPTPGSGDLVFVRTVDAPQELVFRCMIEPEHLTHFWGPMGVSTPLATISVDPRPGGVFETVMVNDADGSRYTMRVVYDEVLPPERLTWTDSDSGMTTTATFTALGPARTEIRIEQANVPEEFRSPQAQAGFATSLDRFAAYVATLSSTGRRSDVHHHLR